VTAEHHQVDVVDVHKKIIREPSFDDEAAPPGSCDVGPKGYKTSLGSDAGFGIDGLLLECQAGR
jgi:hypothetical protein